MERPIMQTFKKSKQDRLFFHDIINHTHGLVLFLSQKKELNEEEINLIKHEIKNLQHLIQNHFQYEHKNKLDNDKVTVNDFRMTLAVLVESFLPAKHFEVKIHFTPQFESYLNQDHELSSSSIQRILGNVIKNIAENCTRKVGLYFDCDQDKLIIQSENLISDKIAQVSFHSQGITSIEHLCNEMGGSYFYIQENGIWKNTITIPLFKWTKEKAA